MQTPTNVILTGLALIDLLVMSEYIPYDIITYLIDFPTPPPEPQKYTKLYRAVFIIFHTHFHCVVHSIASWLHVLLAFWRYQMVRCVALMLDRGEHVSVAQLVEQSRR